MANASQRKIVAADRPFSVQYYSVVPLILQTTGLVATLPKQFLPRFSHRLVSLPLPFETRRFNLHAAWQARRWSEIMRLI
jgi:hypothetical protein